MKKYILPIFTLIVIFVFTQGCATALLATKLGVRIADSYQDAATRGLITAEKSIQNWSYISGLVKGVFADNYELDMPIAIKNIITALDKLSEKSELTNMDKGLVIGFYCRLEAEAVKNGWDKYGVSITSAFKSLVL